MARIELYERYVANTNQLEYLEELGVTNKKNVVYKYRRTNPRVEEIERFIEIVNNKNEFIVRFYGGYELIAKGNFDEMCIKLNDMEENFIEDEIERHETN